jgi:hypothetical protein
METFSDKVLDKYLNDYQLKNIDPFQPIIIDKYFSGARKIGIGTPAPSPGVHLVDGGNAGTAGNSDYAISGRAFYPQDINSVNARIAKRGDSQRSFTDDDFSKIINNTYENLDTETYQQAMDQMLKEINDKELSYYATLNSYTTSSDKIKKLNTEIESLNTEIDSQNTQVDDYTKQKEESKVLKQAARARANGVRLNSSLLGK